MALTAKLQFGDNDSGVYPSLDTDFYMVSEYSCQLLRRHNGARPDGRIKFGNISLTLVAPGKKDLTLMKWYVSRSKMSGRIVITMPSGDEDKEIRFNDGVCYAISEEYHIDQDKLHSLRLQIAAQAVTVEKVVFKSYSNK